LLVCTFISTKKTREHTYKKDDPEIHEPILIDRNMQKFTKPEPSGGTNAAK